MRPLRTRQWWRSSRRWTSTAAALGTAAVVTLSGTSAASAQGATGTAGNPRLRIPSVTAGEARFEILSPTLIRTEYAGDGKFTDAPTFNAIGRGAFAPAAFTADRSDGWLTIRTSAMTLRYRIDSGQFDTGNLSVAATAGGSPVTATPWQHLTCGTGQLCEAENLRPDGVSVAADHTGYTGTGFAAGFQSTGGSITSDIDVNTAGDYQFGLRYANSRGGDGQTQTRTLSVTVDGGSPQTVSLPATADWDTWKLATAPLHLAAGHHTLALTRTAADSGNVNVDSVAVVRPGDPYPPVSSTAVADCRFAVSCEAEAARTGGTAVRATDHKGYAGGGFVAELNQGSSLTTHVVGVPADGEYTLHVRYANGTGGDGLHRTRTATVSAGGTSGTLSLPATADWDT
ncbi:CBM35 domain-containing protein, partial [Streptomyces sp. NPDC048279]|uniref:carbohydrate-binding protein n=1 Tax=Streptomyces sp. NPDC048279 TaxID=3154714 RepID=UPI003438F0E2